MVDANVFNTFSFNKWADTKKEEEIDKETRRRRDHQVKRLKERLEKERTLRMQGYYDNKGFDIEALIEAIQNEDVYVNPPGPMEPAKLEVPHKEKTDDDILEEIRTYQVTHPGRPGTANGPESRFWAYNRRVVDGEAKEKPKQQEEPKPTLRNSAPTKGAPTQPKKDNSMFRYNRIVTK